MTQHQEQFEVRCLAQASNHWALCFLSHSHEVEPWKVFLNCHIAFKQLERPFQRVWTWLKTVTAVVLPIYLPDELLESCWRSSTEQSWALSLNMDLNFFDQYLMFLAFLLFSTALRMWLSSQNNFIKWQMKCALQNMGPSWTDCFITK